MPLGNPQLPCTLHAVLSALPPYFRTLAIREIFHAPPEEAGAHLKRWWKLAAAMPTPQQHRDLVRRALDGDDFGALPVEEVEALLPGLAENLRSAVRALGDMEERRVRRRTEHREWVEHTCQWIAYWEDLAADQKRYINVFLADRRRHGML